MAILEFIIASIIYIGIFIKLISFSHSLYCKDLSLFNAIKIQLIKTTDIPNNLISQKLATNQSCNFFIHSSAKDVNVYQNLKMRRIKIEFPGKISNQ